MKSHKSKVRPRFSQNDIKVKVINALEDGRWDYRTAEGIAKTVQLKVDVVNDVLKSDTRIRHSVLKSKSGKELYTLKKRRSALRDYYTAFRAMNSAKLGDS